MERSSKVRQYFVTAKASFHAYHRWSEAPFEVGFLRDMHRHKFTVEVTAVTEHDDRAVEFITLQKHLKQAIPVDESRLGEASCEQLADSVLEYLLSKAYDVIKVQVWEDEECSGGIWCGEKPSWERRIAALEGELAECRKQILDAQKYATDAHAGAVRNITPLRALQEQSEYYERMMDEQDKELAESRRQIQEGIASQFRIEQTLGMILYGKSEEGLPLWGEHTAETLAEAAAQRLAASPR